MLEQQLEVSRLKSALETLERQTLVIKHPQRLTPMAFPIWAQRISSQTIRVEEAGERIERMIAQLEAAADNTHREDAKDAKKSRSKTKSL